MSLIATLTRRAALGLFAGATLLAAAPAQALSPEEAESFIGEVVQELTVLTQSDGSPDKFLALLDERAAVPQVGKFAMGRNWREMSEAQQTAYQDAFRGYISRTYAKRFNDYAGEHITVTGSIDAGKKGVLVESMLVRPGTETAAVEWLVTDRLGPPLVADIVFEGISLSITLREIFGGMVEKRNGDIDLFIADLRNSDGA